jgi:hypothetical protein
MRILYVFFVALLLCFAPKASNFYYNQEKMSFYQALQSTRAIELGFIQGFSFDTKFGYNADLDNSAEEIIASSGGTFTPPTGAETIDIVSTSTDDDSAGTGARTVTFTCVREGEDPETLTYTMDGTTTVTTTEECLAINRGFVSSVGTGTNNAGDITFSQSTSGIILREIPAGDSITQSCLQYIPAGKKALIENFKFSVVRLGSGAPEFIVYSNVLSSVNGVTYKSLRLSADSNGTAIVDTEYPFTQPLSSGSWLWFTAVTDTNNTFITCRGNIIEIDEELLPN